MKISFLVNHINGGWKPTDTRLGGTEESVVKWTEELRRRGHEVIIYDNDNRDSYDGGEDVCINLKSWDIAPKVPTIYLTNETDADKRDLSAYDAVVWPSQWCIDNIPVNNPKTFILPHGYDPEQIYPEKKIAKQCFYASSPDRGLQTLLRAWPTVRIKHPDATLVVTYGGESILPGVITLGECDEETMNEIYRTSDIWCHPCSGGELYCITGKKAQVAGCIPVIIPTMALAETVERGFKVKDEKDYAQALIEVLDIRMDFRDRIREDVIKHANAYTWEQSTDILLNIIDDVLLK